MKYKTILVTETPTKAQVLLEALQPDDRTIAILASGFYPFEFSYPRGLAISDFPFVGEPAYKRSARREWAWNIGYVFRSDTNRADKITVDSGSLLASEAQVVFACDPDAAGAHAFETLLSQTRARPAGAESAFKALFLALTDTRSIRAAWDTPRQTTDEWFVSALEAGQAKRFFEFNFNVNALAIFGGILRDLGVPNQHAYISKYGLQLLYWLRDSADSLSDTRVIYAMSMWRGTGKYSGMRLGSHTSYMAMLDQLVSAGLVARQESATGGKRLSLTDLGRGFLAKLHPDCEDSDLPGRISQWQSAWPGARPAVERYLRTFFGKQLRFKAANHMP